MTKRGKWEGKVGRARWVKEGVGRKKKKRRTVAGGAVEPKVPNWLLVE